MLPPEKPKVEGAVPLANVRDVIAARQKRSRTAKAPVEPVKPDPNKRLDASEVMQIKRQLKAGVRQKDIALEFGVTAATISQIKRGKTWAHLKVRD